MELKNNKILYLSLHDSENDPGVENKIKGFCRVAAEAGFEVDRLNRYCRSIGQRRTIMKQALRSDARYIIIRSFGTLTVVIADLLIKARKQGRVLVCDQPSPLSTTLNEIWCSRRPLIKRLYAILWGIVSGPWSMWPFHRIVEYAPESGYFSLGNRRSILLTGNGIDISRIKLRNHVAADDGVIHMVGVANTSIHHGFDRIIRALARLRERGRVKADFSIIGGAPASATIISLKELAESLGVSDLVRFHGFQQKEFISDAYDHADLAVGSLGLFRIGLDFSSILKIREYSLSGIPFITAGEDPDFPVDIPFRIKVPNDESIEPIVDALERFHQIREQFSDEDIREYAVGHFSFEKKFAQIMEGLI